MNNRLYYQYGCLAWVSLTVVHICFSIASLQSLGGLPTHMSKWEWESVSHLASSCGACRKYWQAAGKEL